MGCLLEVQPSYRADCGRARVVDLLYPAPTDGLGQLAFAKQPGKGAPAVLESLRFRYKNTCKGSGDEFHAAPVQPTFFDAAAAT